LNSYTPDNEQDINFLLRQALSKVAFLPFGYMIDLWRWKVFDGTYNKTDWNKGWWELRTKYQGIHPPTERPSNAFDPASKSHIDDNTPYLRYFISYVVQFQFYQAMCKIAGRDKPLHHCDFYQNTAAGSKLAEMLQLGSSKPWPEAMKVLTNQDAMDASAILEYFKPLHTWLNDTNQKNKACFGWEADWPASVIANLPQPRCKTATSTPSATASTTPIIIATSTTSATPTSTATATATAASATPPTATASSSNSVDRGLVIATLVLVILAILAVAVIGFLVFKAARGNSSGFKVTG